MAICIQIARRKICQSTIVKSRLIRKRRSKSHPKTFKHEAQTHPKSLQIRCRNWAPEKVGKSDVPDSFRIIKFRKKSDKNPSSCDLFTIFGIQKGIRKSMPKKYGKICQKVPKMRPKWMPKPLIVHTFSKKAKTVETICFTI